MLRAITVVLLLPSFVLLTGDWAEPLALCFGADGHVGLAGRSGRACHESADHGHEVEGGLPAVGDSASTACHCCGCLDVSVPGAVAVGPPRDGGRPSTGVEAGPVVCFAALPVTEGTGDAEVPESAVVSGPPPPAVRTVVLLI